MFLVAKRTTSLRHRHIGPAFPDCVWHTKNDEAFINCLGFIRAQRADDPVALVIDPMN
jgi:hypothetical protein